MADTGGQWLTLREYAEKFHLPLAEVQQRMESGAVRKKQVDGLDYLWVEDQPAAAEQGESVSSGAGPAESGEPVPVAEVRAPAGTQEMVLRTDRALSLVEKSLHTFMLMHREVVKEKERLVEELQAKVRDMEERRRELERILRQREQELADLKMLAGVLEDQLRRFRSRTGEAPARQKERELGDLMEDQLAYLMENELVKDLTES